MGNKKVIEEVTGLQGYKVAGLWVKLGTPENSPFAVEFFAVHTAQAKLGHNPATL